MSPDVPRRTAPLRVVITDEMGRPLPNPALARWLRAVAPARARGVVTLALVPDAAMRRLNRRFAGKAGVTDVLSFPHGRFSHLGDIVIATGVARRQARDAGHSFDSELRTLALHGLLHLLGFDHATDAGAMARIERRLRRKGGLEEGLIDRAGKAGTAGEASGRLPRRSAPAKRRTKAAGLPRRSAPAKRRAKAGHR